MGAIKIGQGVFLKVEELIDTRYGSPFNMGEGPREYTRVWLVVVNDRTLGAGMICRAPGIPAPWSSYMSPDGIEFDDLAVLVRLEAKRKEDDTHYHWIVTATYSTNVPEGGIPALTAFGSDTRGSQNQPWLERPVIEWDWEETTETPSRDLDGKPYVNSAKMPFAPAPTFPASRSVLVIHRNERSWSRDLASKYAHAVSSDVFAGAAPGCAQSYPPRCKMMNRGSLQFYRITYRIRFGLPKLNDLSVPGAPLNREAAEKKLLELQPFQPEILDQGTHQLQTIPGSPFEGKPVQIHRYAHPVTRDVLLDGAGRELRPDLLGRIIPQFIKFRRYHSMPFRPIIETGIFGGI